MDDEQLTPELDRKMLELLKEAALHDYPNPGRIGCPGREFLRRLVDDRRSIDLSDPALDHVARCSPCFQEFSAIRDQANRAKVSRRAAIAAGSTILIAGAASTVYRVSTHSKSSDSDAERYEPADFDMSSGSAERGASGDESQIKPTPDLPKKRLDLSITLPFASPEATYEVQVMGPSGATGVKVLVPVRNNIILAGETAVSGGRFGRHHTRMRRPPPAQDRGRRGRKVADSKTTVMV